MQTYLTRARIHTILPYHIATSHPSMPLLWGTADVYAHPHSLSHPHGHTHTTTTTTTTHTLDRYTRSFLSIPLSPTLSHTHKRRRRTENGGEDSVDRVPHEWMVDWRADNLVMMMMRGWAEGKGALALSAPRRYC